MRKRKTARSSNLRIAVARALLKPHLAALKSQGIAFRPDRALIDGCLYPAYIIARSSLNAVLKTAGLSRKRLSIEICRLRSGNADYTGARNGRFKITQVDLGAKEQAMLRAAVIGYRKTFMDLSKRLGGTLVHLHCGAKRRIERRRELGVFHIFAMSSPSGETDTAVAETIFGLPITRDRETVLLHKPTAGRGVALSDGFGNSVIQVLNGNVYFLVPTINCYHGEVSLIIMRKLIALAVAGLFLETESAGKNTRKEIRSAIREHAEAVAFAFKREIALVRMRIERAQKEQMTAERMLVEMEEGWRICASPQFVRNREKTILDAVKAIAKMPLVRSWYFREGGLHVETRRIAITHKGRRYDLGRFVLRFGERGAVSVWNEQPTHPKGVPHPHISAENGACFGSATRAIAKACAEMHYAEATRIILSWLTDGYAKETALVKLEEWPYAGEKKKKCKAR
jgi:hypothetical protein